ncbi:monocarboxylate transporter 12-like isoform X1 [Diabrotica undecimpunctata]|uniref:monocarboxylate transporter 12-like isoform X1 n=1 Tax=Diabrotica undecimpunctata TaxID=50387 RepID=UPI003B63F532
MAHAPPARKRKHSQDHDIHKFQGKESILTSQIELYIEDVKPKIPDGGWGWMIVLSAFVINGISEGISFSFGLLYVEFLNAFDASKSATSWIGSLFLAMPLLAGPIGSAMVDRYGCISMTVLGSLISTSGFILSMFVNSLTMLYITFGIIGGIGRALTFVTAVVSIAFWFEKKRTIALGLAASGTGVGTIAFAPLTSLFITEYGWRGTVLLLGGAFLNMCVCGVMMRDPKWIQDEARVKKAKKAADKRKAKIKRENTQLVLQRINTTLDLSEKTHFRSVVDLPTFVKENEKVPLEVLNRLSENKQMYKIILENYPNMVPSKSASNQDLHLHENEYTSKARVPVKFSLQVQETDDEQPEDAKVENGKIENHTSPLLYTIPEAIEEPEPHSYLQIMTMSSPDVFNACRSTKRSVNKEVPQKVKKKWYTQFWKSIKGLLNFSLFLELHFLLLAVSTIILFTWFIVPYFYIAEYMLKLGYTDSQASSVLSAIGLTNTIGMVFLGWAGERLNIAKTYAICLIVCGGTIACIIWFSGNYITLLIACGLFGLFFASCFSLLPSLLGELVPLEDFTMAYGLILLCMGIGNLSGPPLSGFIYDLTKTWNMSFYQAACWIIFSGVLIGIIPYTKNKKIVGTGPVLNEQ